MFPVGMLYIYNRPELHNSIFFKSQNEALASFRTPEEDRLRKKIPVDMEHAKRTMEIYDKERNAVLEKKE
jgi:hypothetical protein